MKRRKDNKGRVLKEGESYRKNDGLYMYRWHTKTGIRKAVYDNSLEGLREKEDIIKRDLRDGIKAGESNITLNDVYEMWKKDKRGLKETTRANYFYMYEHFAKDEFGRMKIQAIKKSDVRRFYNSLVDTNKMSINTVEGLHTVIHQVFNLAVEDEYIRINPSDGVMRDCKRVHNYQRSKIHALTIPEQTAFINYIRDTPKYRHWLPLFTFFLGTGARVSEIVGIRWEDVHMEEGYVEINHNTVYYGREKKKCHFSITTPKTEAGKRMIPLLPEVKKGLLEERRYQSEIELSCNDVIDGYSDFVFLNRYGKIHNPQTINRAIRRIARDYNESELDKADKEKREPVLLPPFSCHNLRHTFATRYCENETNLKVIQEILGHKDIATTMDVYAEATKDAKIKSFERLEGKITIS